MKKEIDRLQTQVVCLKVSLQRKDKELNKYKKGFNGATACNKTMDDEIHKLQDENQELKDQLDMLFKFRERKLNEKN